MIRIIYEDFTEGIYSDLKEAKDQILENFAAGVIPINIEELNDKQEETGKTYSCEWDVELVEDTEE